MAFRKEGVLQRTRPLTQSLLPFLFFGVSFLGLCSPSLSQTPYQPRTVKNMELYVPGEILVAFKEGSPPAERAKVLETWGSWKRLRRPELFKVKLSAGKTVDQAVEALRNDQRVSIVQPNYRYAFLSSCVPTSLGDPYYASPQYWPLTIIHAPEAWGLFAGCPATPPGGSSVTVAVIDTGISGTHPDLPVSLQAPGWDFTTDSPDTTDSFGHGTFVAGILAAQWNNPGTETCPVTGAFNGGMAGLAGQMTLLPVKVIDNTGNSTAEMVVEGIDFAVEHGARVLNLSLGSSVVDLFLQQSLDRALAADCVIVAAAGNDGGVLNYPASYPPVLSVGASDENDKVPSYSNGGANLDLVAPGGGIFYGYQPDIGIFSTLLRCPTPAFAADFVPDPFDPHYRTGAGTSPSAPYLSPHAALFLCKTAPLTHEDVIRRILNNADSLGGASGWNSRSGYGRLNVYRALTDSAPDQTNYVKTFNSPNPFYLNQDRYTNITLVLSQPQEVELTIRDSSGEVVLNRKYGPADLNQNPFNPQFKSYFVSWDGKNGDGQRVHTGVYFYEVKSGGRTGRNKIALIQGSR